MGSSALVGMASCEDTMTTMVILGALMWCPLLVQGQDSVLARASTNLDCVEGWAALGNDFRGGSGAGGGGASQVVLDDEGEDGRYMLEDLTTSRYAFQIVARSRGG